LENSSLDLPHSNNAMVDNNTSIRIWPRNMRHIQERFWVNFALLEHKIKISFESLWVNVAIVLYRAYSYDSWKMIHACLWKKLVAHKIPK
jgi:hypothetical protein